MAGDDLHERVATMEGRWGETIPELQRRLGVLETNDAEILEEVAVVRTEVVQIKEMLKNNGFGKKNKNGNNPTIAQLKMETKFSRWMTGIIIGFVSVVLGLLGIFIALK